MRVASDQELVRRFVRGRDGKAFATIVERYRPLLFNVALGLCGNVHDAEDAAQEALVTAYVSMLRLRNPAALGPWLCAIVENKTKLQLRRSRARRAVLRELPAQEAAVAVAHEDPVRTWQEHRQRVWTGLSHLTYNERVVTMLRYIDGLRHREIARFLGVTEGSVRKRLHDAKSKLRCRLESFRGPPSPSPADLKQLNKTIISKGETAMQRTPSVYEMVPAPDKLQRVSYDIIDRMLKDRVVWLSGRLDSQLAISVISQLLFLEQLFLEQEKPKPREGEDNDVEPQAVPSHVGEARAVSLYVSSPGGHLMQGLAVYDTVQWISSPVWTFGVGPVTGVATLLVAAGEPGKRRALPNAGFMLLEPERPEDQQITEFYEEKALVKFRVRFFDLLAKHTGRDRSKVERDARKGVFLTAEEAKEYGIVDEILLPRDKPNRQAIPGTI